LHSCPMQNDSRSYDNQFQLFCQCGVPAPRSVHAWIHVLARHTWLALRLFWMSIICWYVKTLHFLIVPLQLGCWSIDQLHATEVVLWQLSPDFLNFTTTLSVSRPIFNFWHCKGRSVHITEMTFLSHYVNLLIKIQDWNKPWNYVDWG